jgi:hypothetical protein
MAALNALVHLLHGRLAVFTAIGAAPEHEALGKEGKAWLGRKASGDGDDQGGLQDLEDPLVPGIELRALSLASALSFEPRPSSGGHVYLHLPLHFLLSPSPRIAIRTLKPRPGKLPCAWGSVPRPSCC